MGRSATRIRRCVPGDVPEICSIVNDAAQAYKGIIPADCWHEPYMPLDELKRQIAEGVAFWCSGEQGAIDGVMGIQDRGEVSLIRHAYVRTALRRTGIGETLLPLVLPKMPCVMVNPRVPVATKDVFEALGLRNGEFLVGVTDVLEATGWPQEDASIADWIEALSAAGNDLEAPATRVQPVISEVLSSLRAADGAGLARMSGSGATCFAVFENGADALRAAHKIRLDHPQWWVHAGVLS